VATEDMEIVESLMVLTTILEVVISLIIEITIDTRVMEAIKR
jgi:hypothetical protein